MGLGLEDRAGTPEEALLKGREAACLSNENVSDLAHLDADEEHGVASVLLVQTLPKCLWNREQKRPELKGRASAASLALGLEPRTLNCSFHASEPRMGGKEV